MGKLVSIIIPVYNGEKYIKRCLESAVNQTYKDIEIIVLNDGSSDRSEEIIRLMAKDDSRIYYYSHDNMGVGKTRNRGIELSTGEYITFLDADDTYELNYVETLAENMEGRDILISGYQRIGDGIVKFEAKPKDNEWSHFKYTATSGKMFRRDFLNNNHIRYQDYKIGEDILFSLTACGLSESVKVTEYAGYHAFYNPSSVTKQMNNHVKRNHIIPVLEEVKALHLEEKYGFRMVAFFLCKTIAQHLYNQVAILTMEQLIEEVEENVRWLRNLDYKKNVFQLQFEKSDTFIINISVFLFILSCKCHVERMFFRVLKKTGFKRDQ